MRVRFKVSLTKCGARSERAERKVEHEKIDQLTLT